MSLGDNPWVCIASGFSLRKDDIDRIKGRAKLATAGRGYQLCDSDVSIHFAADYPFWDRYHGDIMDNNPGIELWTCSTRAAKKFLLNHACVIPDNNRTYRLKSWGWSNRPGYVYSGGLSGYMLLQVVGWQKPTVIILLGYDCQHGPNGERHFNGGDYQDLSNVDNIEKNIEAFDILARQTNVKIINCSRESRLCFFEKGDIDEIFP